MAKTNGNVSQHRYDYIAKMRRGTYSIFTSGCIILNHTELNNACFVGPLHSAAMKLSLIVAAVVLALAQGTVWPSYDYFLIMLLKTYWFFLKFNYIFFCLWKPTGSLAQTTDLEKISQYFEEMKTKMTEMMSTQDLASHAQWVE